MVLGKNASKVAEVRIEEIEKSLAAKDGNNHVLIINDVIGAPKGLGVNDRLTVPLEKVFSLMYSRGYEVVDVKLNIDYLDSLAGYCNVLIIYR